MVDMIHVLILCCAVATCADNDVTHDDDSSSQVSRQQPENKGGRLYFSVNTSKELFRIV
jgi:hypothetical protein